MRREEAVAVTSVAAPEPGRDGEQPRPPAELGRGARGEPGGGGPQESCKQRKKFLYSEPHKRIKEVLEEELYIKRDECHIKNPPAGFPVTVTDSFEYMMKAITSLSGEHSLSHTSRTLHKIFRGWYGAHSSYSYMLTDKMKTFFQ